eukprot:GEMP01022668.1.p1 GENE.GEMP01022668.1~~GEMP01022668.1.p1  ORF type:complete len:147 (+),score=20.82 GEMP01022668.1:53-442(+)
MNVISKLDLENCAKNGRSLLCIRGKVLDVKEWFDKHPGGPDVLKGMIGKDATEEFDDVNHSNSAKGMIKEFQIGTLEGETAVDEPETELEKEPEPEPFSFSWLHAGYVAAPAILATCILIAIKLRRGGR